MNFNKLFYNEIDSTNEEAKRLIKQGVIREVPVIIAETQTAGYGKWGRPWFSPVGEGLYFSVILHPGQNYPPLVFSILGTIASVRTIRVLTGLEAKVKWPNDVMANGKKIGGILAEQVKDKIIIGIGLNVNTRKFPEELSQQASSLFLQHGKELDKNQFLDLLLEEFDQLYLVVKKDKFGDIQEEWESFSETVGREVKVVTSSGELKGKAIGLGEKGELILETADGKIVKINSGDVFDA